MIARHGFNEAAFHDLTAPALEWMRERVNSAPSTPPPLGLHLLLGRNFKPAFKNQRRNLEEGRAAVIEAVYERDSKAA